MRPVGSGAARSAAAFFLLMATCCLLPSCSSRTSSTAVQFAASPAGALATSDQEAVSLPGLDALPDPQRTSSYLGHGWYQVPILEQGELLASSAGVSQEAEGIRIEAGIQAAWAIFGIHGFDGDSFPSALACEVAETAGEFQLAAANYRSGRWEFGGPFTQDGQFEYAAGLEASDPRNYLSKSGFHFVSVVASPDSSLLLHGLQLGVDGGLNAPAKVDFLSTSRIDEGVQLTWSVSADSFRPDFAGYIIERAIWPGTQFQPVSDLITARHHFDDTVEPEEQYRYRIRSLDLAGNGSTGRSTITFSPLQNLPPVCLIDIPAGPLYGAQQVTIDLSSSFDHEQDSFTEYRLLFGSNSSIDTGIGEVSNTDGLFNLLLQPGCYRIIGIVTAGSSQGSAVTDLKIYPQWDGEPQMLAAAPQTHAALTAPSSVQLPAIGGVACFGLEPMLPGLGLLLKPAGAEATLQRIVPARFGIDGISEAVLWNGLALCAAVDGSGVYIAYTDGEVFDWLEFARGFAKGSGVDLVVGEEGEPRICFIDENFMPVSRLLSYVHGSNADPVELVPLFEGEHLFDVEWNEQQQSFDILYGQPGKLFLRRCNGAGGLLFEKLVMNATPDYIDLEIEPASGTPCLLLRSGNAAIYTQYDNLAETFMPSELVEPGVATSYGEDLLLVDGEPVVALGNATQPLGIYRRNGGSWDRQPADWAADSGLDSSLAAMPGGGLLLVDSAADKRVHVVEVPSAAGFGEVQSLLPTGPQGRDLNAVAGSDGLHAIWCADGISRHYRNPEDGSGWQAVNLLDACQSQDLMADINGKVYLSTRVDNASFLLDWNGAEWNAIWFTLNNLNQTNPWMAMQSNSPAAQWFYLENDLPNDRLHYITDIEGMGLQDYSSSIYPEEVMEGAGVFNGSQLVSILALGNGVYPDGRVAWLDKYRDNVHVMQSGSSSLQTEESGLLGRQLDACMGKHTTGNSLTVFYSASSAFGSNAIRYSGFSQSGDFNMTEQQPFSFESGGQEWESLRTVSAAQAWGLTCVGLVDQSFAAGAVLEWDDFGEFEQLPLPPLDFKHTNMHELVVGNDGRWHILYHDLSDGGIYAISST